MNKSTIKCKVKEIIINDFSKVNLGNNVAQSNVECSQMYNFKVSKGVLKRGMGVRTLMTYESNDFDSLHYNLDYQSLNLDYINKVMYFKQYFSTSGDTTHRLLIHGSDGKLYLFQMFSGLDTPNWVYRLQFDTIPIVLEYKKGGLDSILISANDKLMVWFTGRTPYEVANVPTITSMCVYNDVLYCTIAGETDKIWYTSNLDPESVGSETEETKYLTMEGSAGGGQKIVMLKENMYVFCDYGIGRINTYAKDDATYNQIYVSNSQIYPNTVVDCGDCVMFVTRDGIYRFNGSSVTRVEVLQKQMINSFNEYAVATHLKGSYYLATQVQFESGEGVGIEGCVTEYKNNALIKLDLNDYSFEIMRGLDVKDMLALKAGVEEKLVLTFNGYHQAYIGELTDEVGGILDISLDAKYSTNYIIDESLELITISGIKFDASKNVRIGIITDNGEKKFNAYCDGVNEFHMVMPCRKFKVEIIDNFDVNSNSDMYVNWVKIEYIKQA